MLEVAQRCGYPRVVVGDRVVAGPEGWAAYVHPEWCDFRRLYAARAALAPVLAAMRAARANLVRKDEGEDEGEA